MSSILKALKKLEREGAPPDSLHARMAKRYVDPKAEQAAERRSRRTSRIQTWSLLAVGLALVVFGLYWWVQGHRPANINPAPATPPSQPKRPDKPPAPSAAAPTETPASMATTVAPAAADAQPPRATHSDQTMRTPSASATEKPLQPSAPPPKPALSLEGIVWSQDVQQRMAVVNGRMLTEGMQIDGVDIVSIGQDDVTVRQGSRQWKLYP